MARKTKLAPIHPGQILKEEFLTPFELSANQLALRLHVPSGRVIQIINGERSITPDTALRLAKFFGNSAEFWLNLQSHYDLQVAQDTILDEIDQQVQAMRARA